MSDKKSESIVKSIKSIGTQEPVGWPRSPEAVAADLQRLGDPVEQPSRSAAAAVGVHELGLASAALAIRTGAITSESYAKKLLERAHGLSDLMSFITIDPNQVLEAARAADKARAAGKVSPLLGVPIGVKDSYMTRNLATTFGTKVLSKFNPEHDAAVVTTLTTAGAIVFGKNNLAEMSYSLTGFNAHHGQPKNPHRRANITGGSSSGAGAAVAAQIVPAALAGDTVGSIRVPASLCGVVGFKPTPGRWPDERIAPISSTLDAAGVMARSVEDCMLVDSIVSNTELPPQITQSDLRGVKFAFAPKQYLDGVDPHVERKFREALYRIKNAGAQLVEVDMGPDFSDIAERATWPIFFYETMCAVRGFLERNKIPATFEQIYEGLGTHTKGLWSKFVVPQGAGVILDATYRSVMTTDRLELQRRYRDIAFAQADALLFPTTPCAAPTFEEQWKFRVAGKDVSYLILSKNTYPTNCAGLPGISIPMGMTPDQLPLGIEIDAPAGHDRALLVLARRVESAIGEFAPPHM